MRHLPPGTLTSLLPPDTDKDAPRLADMEKRKATAASTVQR
jgi:hypothetical protein